MLRFRLIPKLDIKGNFLVKGRKLEGLRVLGPPSYFAKEYAKSGADELIYLDVVASLYGRNSLTELVSETVSSTFIPITVGGGIKSLNDIQKMLEAGADKVAINSEAIKNPSLIDQAARIFGSSTIVISIQAKWSRNRNLHEAYFHSGRENSEREVGAWAKEVEERGAGEILLTSVDRDGTGTGYDDELNEAIRSKVSIPIIASGGAGNIDDIVHAAKCADALSFGSITHYKLVENLMESNFDFGQPGEFKILENSRNSSKVSPATFTQIREKMLKSS